MNDNSDYIELVEQAQFGSRESLDSLAQRVRGRLYAYVYRITLIEDVSQDLVQESLLEMINSINNLERADRFWPWLRGIAFNKIRRYYTHLRNHRTFSISNYDSLPQTDRSDKQSGPHKLMGDEVRQIVFNAMKQLKPKHRAILAMRCYEDMPYSQIALLVGTSELNTRVLFCRAKEALHKQLSRKGFGKGFLLSALALFGKMTAPAEAAAAPVTVTATATEVGVTATLLAAASSKTTIVTTIVAAGAMAAGTTLMPVSIDKATGWIDAIKQQLAATKTVAVTVAEHSENWYYYPAKTNGPVMTRLMKWQPGAGRYCQQLETENANYYFDRTTNTIHINNYRMFQSDLSVRRLPTDNSDLTGFISKLEGTPQSKQPEHISSEQNGLLVIADHGQTDVHPQTMHNYNLLQEEYFRYDWPEGAKVIDNRDAMHKRGWTYFRITGHINGQQVSGTGRIPFVYAASRQHSPWLKLSVADRLKIADSTTGASVNDEQGTTILTCSAGSFFKGLARPWMGLHTIDTIRRDAAEQQLPFETSYTPPSPTADVIITFEQNKITYTVDMEKDVIEKITVTGDGTDWKEKAVLNFSYLDDVKQLGSEFVEPRQKPSTGPRRQQPGLLWLISLIENQW